MRPLPQGEDGKGRTQGAALKSFREQFEAASPPLIDLGIRT
jgi:hypothetical protein